MGVKMINKENAASRCRLPACKNSNRIYESLQTRFWKILLELTGGRRSVPSDKQSWIENLRQTDVALSDSIELHEKALTEYRKLHRNLTVISDSVKFDFNTIKLTTYSTRSKKLPMSTVKPWTRYRML
ncbi:unnamed protein product [Clavelina lepadiformis]|uniref:Uncharacterized protein n=1 Tax=Clavelina lepadiformis TaxID=159417 RepID=A0ABP0FI15_CLALP